MHVLNRLFSKVFLITTEPPNSRLEYFVEYYNSIGLNYDLRVATNSSYFKKVYDGSFEINEQEQSLESAYASIFYESYYKKLDNIVILEDDNRFVENFEELFLQFYKNVPDDWDFLNLSSYQLGYHKNKENYIVTSVNEYVDKIKIKHSSNCTIFRNTNTYKMIADKIVGCKYPVDLVMTDFSYNDLLNSYSSNTDITNQLSTRLSDVPSDKFKSLIR
jgi:hypothetical protein